ncbi:MAG: hypothetical protein ACR2QM_06235 [Longimicrobiales bacterium]
MGDDLGWLRACGARVRACGARVRACGARCGAAWLRGLTRGRALEVEGRWLLVRGAMLLLGVVARVPALLRPALGRALVTVPARGVEGRVRAWGRAVVLPLWPPLGRVLT